MTRPDDGDTIPVIIGLPGPHLGAGQRSVLEEVRPAGVILFARNIVDAEQTRNLITDLSEVEPRPFICVDLEGGAVNRLEAIWGDLPSPSSCAAVGRRCVRSLGQAAGAACRALGIQLNLAPVVDLFRTEGLIGKQGRTLSREPERTAELARVYAKGLTEWGVSACLKHFPGLGSVTADTHDELPVLEDGAPELDRHLEVFAALSQDIPLVMVGHVIAPALGDRDRPASLARSVVRLAADLPGSPVVLTDDLEMGALKGLGDLPGLVVQALKAESHGALVCRSFDRLEEIAETLERESRDNETIGTRLEAASARLSTLRRELCQSASAVPAPDDDTVRQLWEAVRVAATAEATE